MGNTIIAVVLAYIFKILNMGWVVGYMLFFPPLAFIVIGGTIFHIYSHSKFIKHSGSDNSRQLLASNILIVLAALTCPDFSDADSYLLLGLIMNPPDELFLVAGGMLALAAVLDMDLYAASE